MKKLYKRIIAVALCLALAAAITPTSVFASTREPSPEENAYWLELGFVPGQLIVTLYEQYYRVDDEVYGDLADILPEIEIESYRDMCLCVLTDAQKQTISKDKPDYAANIGTTFLVILSDKTPETTEASIRILEYNPYIKWAEKNLYLSGEDAFDVEPDVDVYLGEGDNDKVWIAPGQLRVTLYEQYYRVDDEVYGNLADILPEIEIESYLDQYLCVLNDAQRRTISERDPEYAAMIGRNFHVILADKTLEATEAAIEALKDNPYVMRANVVICAFGPDALDVEPDYTVADALIVLRVAAGLLTPELGEDFDIDGDGKVTVNDALIVLRIAAGLA
ncbi:MAG: hypothetical protein J5756_06135 [Clostridia bacterium]|nr:hypothetical protein [Clostridia bacterium]